MDLNSTTNEFENFLSPLVLMSNIVFLRSGLSRVLKLKHDYQDSLQKNPDAITSLNSITKDCIKEVIQSLSTTYRNKLKQIYSDNGLILLIDHLIKDEMSNSLDKR